MLDLRRREVIAVLSGVVMILPLGAPRTDGKHASGGRVPGRPTAFICRSMRYSYPTDMCVAWAATCDLQIAGSTTSTGRIE